MTFAKRLRQADYHWFLPVAVAVVVFLPLFWLGVPRGNDLPHHFQSALTFVESWRDGVLYPSWPGGRNFGYGGLEVRLYPPLAHYALALAFLSTGDWHLAYSLVVTFFSVVGAVGAYRLAGMLMPPSDAVWAGALFALMPYHLNQIYNAAFFAEFAGLSLLPFVFASALSVCRNRRWSDAAGLTVSLALLILTHLPLTVIGLLLLAVLVIAEFGRGHFPRQLHLIATGLGGGLLISSFYWIKVVTERGLMAGNSVYPEPSFNHSLNYLLTFLQTYDEFGATVRDNGTLFLDVQLFFTILIVGGTMIPTLFVVRPAWRQLTGMIGIGCLSFLLMTPISFLLWDHVAVIRELQFPWRFMGGLSLAAAVVSAPYAARLGEILRSPKRPLALIMAGVILAFVTFSAAQIIRPANYLSRSEVAPFVSQISNDKGLEFWWPQTARRDFAKRRELFVTGGTRRVDVTQQLPTKLKAEFSDGPATDVRVARFYYPLWQATANGSSLLLRPSEDDGAIEFDLPAGAVSVELTFREPRSVKLAQAASLAGASCLLVFYLGLLFRSRRQGAIHG